MFGNLVVMPQFVDALVIDVGADEETSRESTTTIGQALPDAKMGVMVV